MSKRKAKSKAVRGIRSLPAEKLSAEEAGDVKGGAFDSFAKLGDIKGESMDDRHKDWIEVLSYSHGVTQPKP